MNRFKLFVVGNLCVVSLVGWLQWNLFDLGGPAGAASHWAARAGGVRWHKRTALRGRRRRPECLPDRDPAIVTVDILPEDPPWNGSSPIS